MTDQRYNELHHANEFIERHIGISVTEQAELCSLLGYSSIDELIAATVPASTVSPPSTESITSGISPCVR